MSASTTLNVKSTDSLGRLHERSANDADIQEVIFEEGVYFGGFAVNGPEGREFVQHALPMGRITKLQWIISNLP